MQLTSQQTLPVGQAQAWEALNDITLLHYVAQASVGGKMAQIGSRLVDMAAQKMATEFFEAFNKALQERYGVVEAERAAADAAPAGGFFARVLAWLRKLVAG